ncbi:unnamed protein product, partial [Ectocarpus sp. 12 AP-2014]
GKCCLRLRGRLFRNERAAVHVRSNYVLFDQLGEVAVQHRRRVVTSVLNE